MHPWSDFPGPANQFLHPFLQSCDIHLLAWLFLHKVVKSWEVENPSVVLVNVVDHVLQSLKSNCKQHTHFNCKIKFDLNFTSISGSVGLRPARRIAQSKLWKQIVGGFKKNYRGFNNSHWLGWCCCDSSRSGQKLPWSKAPLRPPPLSSSSLQNSSQTLWNDCKCQRFLWMRFVVSCRVCKAVWPAPVVAGTELADSSNLCSHLPGEKKPHFININSAKPSKKGPSYICSVGEEKL